MERLTTEYIGYHVPIATCSMNRLGEADDCSDCKETCEQYAGACSTCPIQKAFSKLAEYEDLEEQGRLLRLPCNIGEPIFVIPSVVNYKLNVLNGFEKNNRVYEQIVCNVVFTKNDYLLNTCDGFCNVRGKGYGETWFLCREEAEAALQEMQEGAE
ncbi:MAG: hypothetical protein ABS949_14870 [Solibacillus sp.]